MPGAQRGQQRWSRGSGAGDAPFPPQKEGVCSAERVLGRQSVVSGSPAHVPHTTHSLHLGLEGQPLIPVAKLSSLQEILVAPVARVLVAHPAAEEGKKTPA